MRLWKRIDSGAMSKITYAVDYEDDRSFLNLHFYKPGIVSCGYGDRMWKDPSPGAGYFLTDWLDLLVVTGFTEEMLREVKRQRMDAVRAAQYLNTTT